MDQHVGSRVRMRRKMLAMSQEQLADALGITYQQVQKNEAGINRIAASRLQQISHILQVPVAFFFRARQMRQRRTAPMARYRWPRLMTLSPIQTA
jgi:transcriptional regulator with XRE-family HTH domain